MTAQKCPVCSAPNLNDPRTVEIALLLTRAATDPAYRNGTLIEGLCHTLAMRIIHAFSDDLPPLVTTNKRIERVLNYIENNLVDSKLSIEELASVACVSPHQLSRIFKSSMGRTLHQVVLARRILIAKVMLSGDKSLSEIAYQCGFSSQSHFATRFRNLTGETPTTFRKRIIG